MHVTGFQRADVGANAATQGHVEWTLEGEGEIYVAFDGNPRRYYFGVIQEEWAF